MAEHDREGARDVSRHVVVVAMAHTRRFGADDELSRPGHLKFDVFDRQRQPGLSQYRCTHRHHLLRARPNLRVIALRRIGACMVLSLA